MGTGDQYKEDCSKLAGLVERFTGIPRERAFFFVMENAAAELLPCSNMICETESQREKLSALFDFKNLYETLKGAEKNREHSLSDTSEAMEYFKNYYADMNDKERFSVAFLDSHNRVIATKTLSSGSVNESAVYPRELIKEALFFNAVSVMLAHNHPGGVSRPSQEDLMATSRVKQGMDTVGVRLLDHIIVAGDKAISLADMGQIDLPSNVPGLAKAASPTVREKDSSPKTKMPTIKEQIAAGKKQLAEQRAAVPTRAAVKMKNNALEV